MTESIPPEFADADWVIQFLRDYKSFRHVLEDMGNKFPERYEDFRRDLQKWINPT